MIASTPFVTLLATCLLFLATPATAFSRRACQAPTRDPLSGCPRGTILVGPSSKFTTVQSAILSLPNNTVPYTILITPGNYTEQLNITRPGPVTLLGQTRFPNDATKNVVNIIWSNATGTATTGTYDNLYTSTLTIAPTLNSSATGAGPQGNPVPAGTPFGNKDFRSYNINFLNVYRPYSAGPALALSVSYANAGFYYCGFYSYQDTVYVGKLGNSYMYKSIIAGQTDFFYGFGTLWVQSSEVLMRGCGGGITAWKGTNTTFENKYGVYIHDSDVKKENSTLQITKQCALGRPWNAQHRSIFANSRLDDSIRDSGYIIWSATDPRIGINTTMAEYKDFGPGFNLTGRLVANVTKVFDDRQYAPYNSLEKVFQQPFSGEFGNTAWIDRRPEA
ncbi:Pectinesterase-like protein 1 [Elsinoe fawcettii]|nr:Pectinesterase-like protein 1 [Elsinoe fawcettii]